MDNLKRVILVGPITSNGRIVGGVGTMLSSILEESLLFKEKGYLLEPFSTCQINRPSETAGHMKFTNFANYAKCKRLLKTICKTESPDILYLHSSVGIGLLKDLFLCRHIKSYVGKVVIHIHSSDPKAIFLKPHFLKYLVIKYLKLYCNDVVVLSDEMKNYLLSLGFENRHCYSVPNFTTMAASKEEITQKIKKRALDPTLNLLFMGSLTKNKGFFDLLESLGQIHAGYQLTVCGMAFTKDDENKINKIVKSNAKIKLLGYVTGQKKREALMDSDIILLPSYTEGLPVCLIEGISFGCYVITTPVGSIPEYFSLCGKMIPAGDQRALGKAIEESIENKESLQSTQTRNYDYSLAFSAKQFVNDVCLLFSK